MSPDKPDGWGAGHLLAGRRGAPGTASDRLHEVARYEWRLADGGDPAEQVQRFLSGAELGVDDLSGPVRRRPSGVCGAALFVSAAAGAAMIGAPPGAASPVPRLPDVAAVLYARGPAAARSGSARVADAGVEPWWLGRWRESWRRVEHAHAVRRVREAIEAGDVYQVNVVGHASAGYRGDLLPALRRVAALPGARYPGILTGDGWAIACASPETLVQVTAGTAISRPIKGTRPATRSGRRALLASEKERAEHVMIVDLVRNDLAVVAVTGTVQVDRLYSVRRWCDLWQAESTVSARLAPGTGLADLLRAVCPGGSVTGAPKIAALHQIATLEPVGRGPSMGALGWIDATGYLDLGLTIRTAAAADGRLHVWAGGGITWGSEPEAEVAEASAKAAPIRAALGPASIAMPALP